MYLRREFISFNCTSVLVFGFNNKGLNIFNAVGDMSSLSGSDTETDDDLSLESSKIEIPVPEFSKDDAVDNEKILGRHHPKIFLINQDGSVLSIFQTIIYSVKVCMQILYQFHCNSTKS